MPLEHSSTYLTSDLLNSFHFTSQNVKEAIPLLMEFDINPDTGPFLVSSTKSLIWLTPKTTKLRAAFREIDINVVYMDVIDAVRELGSEAEWGNVQPFTVVGLKAAIAHILSYNIPSPEILSHPDTIWGEISLSHVIDKEGEAVRYFAGCRIQDALWLPPNYIVVVPKDRGFVGMVLHAGTQGLVVVHNASRGIAICQSAP